MGVHSEAGEAVWDRVRRGRSARSLEPDADGKVDVRGVEFDEVTWTSDIMCPDVFKEEGQALTRAPSDQHMEPVHGKPMATRDGRARAFSLGIHADSRADGRIPTGLDLGGGGESPVRL